MEVGCRRSILTLIQRQSWTTNGLWLSNRTFHWSQSVLAAKQKPTELGSAIVSNSFLQPRQTPSLVYIVTRSYAKGKDKRKPEKGKKASVQVNDEELAKVINLDTLKSQMQKNVDKLKEEYIQNLSLRSTTGSIETLKLTLEGKDYELQELAQIVRKNPKTVVVNMTAFPQAIPIVIQVIQKSGMNLNPQQDGTTLFIPVPKITKEHRENLSKNAKVLFIKCRDSIKDVQNKFLKNVKSNAEISQDISHDVQNQIISLADQYIASADKIMVSKQAELTGAN